MDSLISVTVPTEMWHIIDSELDNAAADAMNMGDPDASSHVRALRNRAYESLPDPPPAPTDAVSIRLSLADWKTILARLRFGIDDAVEYDAGHAAALRAVAALLKPQINARP